MQASWIFPAPVAASRAAALETPPAERRQEELRRVLVYGLWNNLINALYDLGEFRRDALPVLRYASDDADRQVRLTVVHFLGRIGPAPAADELGKRGAEAEGVVDDLRRALRDKDEDVS